MESTWTARRKQKKSKQKNMNHYKAFKHCKNMYVRVYLSYVRILSKENEQVWTTFFKQSIWGS